MNNRLGGLLRRFGEDNRCFFDFVNFRCSGGDELRAALGSQVRVCGPGGGDGGGGGGGDSDGSGGGDGGGGDDGAAPPRPAASVAAVLRGEAVLPEQGMGSMYFSFCHNSVADTGCMFIPLLPPL